MRSIAFIVLALPLWAAAAPPAANLMVELRWVDSSASGAAMAGARDGGLVVGTAGTATRRPSVTLGTTRGLSSERADEAALPPMRLVVMNGRSAGITLKDELPTQWLDYGVELPAAPGGQARVYAAPRNGSVERTRGFSVTPQWPGGRQPVQVELRSTEAEIVYSTLQAPLGAWVTVARTGAVLHAPQPGVVSSRDAEPQRNRELQLRVSLAP